WAMQEGDGLLLLEEPELSLNDSIVEYIPLMIERVLRDAKKPERQVLISTHSEALLSRVEDGATVLRVEPGDNGSEVCKPSDDELQAMEHLNPAEVLLPKTRPTAPEQLGLF
ncbi:MAG: chromosome segregation protein SMC, partial [Ottowia sp.]|nr:chromosome segregation protein SMC [Ottowia sp.]